MAKMRSNASLKLNGRVGAFTFYTSEGRQISRVSENSSNYGKSATRTKNQQSRRVRWANLVNFYKLSRNWMYYAFENKKPGVSDYNKFMSININGSIVALTREQAASGGCVVEPFQVTEGSLMPIQIEHVGNQWQTNIKSSLAEINENTTIGEFTQSVLGLNSWLHENMQISFISYQQTVSAYNIPRAICTAYEVTLKLNSTQLLRDYLPDFCSTIVNNALGTNDNISIGAFTYVLSDTVEGKTLVSTQRLINNNILTIGEYSTNEQINAAIKSYGENSKRFLMSGSEPTTATGKEKYLVDMLINNFGYTPASKVINIPSSTPITIELVTSWVPTEITSITLYTLSSSNQYAEETKLTETTIENRRIVTKITPKTGKNFKGSYLKFLAAVIDGVTYRFGNGGRPVGGDDGDGPTGE